LDNWPGATIARALRIARRVAAGERVLIRAGSRMTVPTFALIAAGIIDSATVTIGGHLWHELRRAGR
jgi:hypothetical protein